MFTMNISISFTKHLQSSCFKIYIYIDSLHLYMNCRHIIQTDALYCTFRRHVFMNNISGTQDEGLLFYMPGDLMVILSHVTFKYQLSSDDPLYIGSRGGFVGLSR